MLGTIMRSMSKNYGGWMEIILDQPRPAFHFLHKNRDACELFSIPNPMGKVLEI
jgi:hypothetical protein